MSPVELSAFLGVTALSAIVSVTWLGAVGDRDSRGRIVYVALLLGALGYLVCAVLPSRNILMFVGIVLLGPSSAIFPLIYGEAKRWTDSQSTVSDVQAFSLLRAATSSAWVVGPLVAGTVTLIASRPVVFALAASLMILAMLALLMFAPRRSLRTSKTTRPKLSLGRAAFLPLCGISLYNICLFMGSTALSIHVSQRFLHGDAYVGYIASFSALLQVAAIYIVSKRTYRNPTKTLANACVMFGAYSGITRYSPFARFCVS